MTKVRRTIVEKLTKKSIGGTYAIITNRRLLYQIMDTADHYGLHVEFDIDVFGRRGTHYVILCHTYKKMSAKRYRPKSNDSELSDTIDKFNQINKYQLMDYVANYRRRIIQKAKNVYHEQ